MLTEPFDETESSWVTFVVAVPVLEYSCSVAEPTRAVTVENIAIGDAVVPVKDEMAK